VNFCIWRYWQAGEDCPIKCKQKRGRTAREIRRKGEKKEAKLRLQMLNPVKATYIGRKDLDRGCAFKR
jgi:hypothetical protein